MGTRTVRSGYTRKKCPIPFFYSCADYLLGSTSQINFWTRGAALQRFCLQNWERRVSFWYEIKHYMPKADTMLWILVKLLWWSDHPSCRMLAYLKRCKSPSKDYALFCSGITICHSHLEAFHLFCTRFLLPLRKKPHFFCPPRFFFFFKVRVLMLVFTQALESFR